MRLRLWFGNVAGGPFELLAPDQKVASLPGIPGAQGPQGPSTTDANTLYIGSDEDEDADEADSTLQFGTDTAPKVSLLEDGSVGIGTPTPEEKLEVAGGINIRNNSGTPKAGTVRWTGTDFEGYNGTEWVVADDAADGRFVGRKGHPYASARPSHDLAVARSAASR